MSGFGQFIPILSAGLTYLDQQRQFDQARTTNAGVDERMFESIFGQARTLAASNNRVNSAFIDQLLANVSGTNDFWASSAKDILGVDLPGMTNTLDRDLLQRIALVPNVDAQGNPTVGANGSPITSSTARATNVSWDKLTAGKSAVPPDTSLQFLSQQTGTPVAELRDQFQAYTSARNSGASAERASDMAALEAARGTALSANQLNYASRIATVMGIVSGLGAQEARDISERYRSQQGEARQSLVASGLSGGANTATLGAQFARAESAEQARLGERIRSMNANVYSQLSGDALAARERLTAGYDAARRGDIAAALGFAGNAASNNVNQFNALAQDFRNVIANSYVQGPPQPNIGQAISQGANQWYAAAGTRAQVEALNPSWYESIGPAIGGGLGAGIAAPLSLGAANVVGGGINFLGGAAGFGNLVPRFGG